MKTKLLLASALSLAVAASAIAATDTSPSSNNSSDISSQASYLLGYHLIAGFKEKNVPIDIDQFTKGAQLAESGGKLSMSQADQEKTMQEFQEMVAKKLQAEQAVAGSANAKTGKAFLEKIAKEPGVKALPGGVLYKVIKQGTGPVPKDTDSVVVNYEGKLTDGKVFDSSYERHEPAIFGVDQVIKGWTEALTHMPVGSTWMIYIPSDLAYGSTGTPGGPIPPDSTLIFKVDLLKIK